MDHGRPELPPNVARCHELIAELQQQNSELRQQLTHVERVRDEQQITLTDLQAKLEQAAEQITLLKRAFFRHGRERYVPSPDQKLLFPTETWDLDSEPPVEPTEASTAEDDANSNLVSPPARKRKCAPKRKRFEFPQFLRTERIEHPLPAEELACPCGCGARVVIAEHVTKQLELEPIRAHVAAHVRFTYACPKCRAGQHVVTTVKPATADEKGLFGPTTLAWLGDAKFARHLPTYRLQEMLQTATTMWFARSVLCGALLRAAETLHPLQDLVLWQLLQGCVINADETPFRVLRPGTGKSHQAYIWAYAGDAQHPYVLFDFHLDRSRAGPREILGAYRGGLQTDGHSAYAALIRESLGGLVDLGCWAHGRRGFEEACAVTTHVVAHEALAWIGQLYDLEDRVRDQSPAERLRLRQLEAVPILSRLEERLRSTLPTLRPSSKLANAMGYVLNRWSAMVRYTSDARFEIDNNLIERLLRPVAIGRNNYMFFGSDRGGHAAATWYSIIQSARRNCVDILPYLTDVLIRLPVIVPEYLPIGTSSRFESLTATQRSALEELLPDRWLAAHPQHLLSDRVEELDAAKKRRRRRRASRRATPSR
jgi:transposase